MKHDSHSQCAMRPDLSTPLNRSVILCQLSTTRSNKVWPLPETWRTLIFRPSCKHHNDLTLTRHIPIESATCSVPSPMALVYARQQLKHEACTHENLCMMTKVDKDKKLTWHRTAVSLPMSSVSEVPCSTEEIQSCRHQCTASGASS